MLSVCHIAERDSGGGAHQASHKLHSALLGIGVCSTMCVGWKTTCDKFVVEVKSSGLTARVRRWIGRTYENRKLSRYLKTKRATLEVFTLGQGVLGRDLVKCLPSADVYTLHWSDQLVDYDLLFKAFGRKTPVVWRLPDMNAMTGGCHYTLGCDRFTETCGCCPQLGSRHEVDLSRQVYLRKKRALSRLSPELVRVVAPSLWMKSQAERSSLLNGFPVVQISTGVDTDVFQPRDQRIAREVLGLPPNDPVVLFVADSVANYRKGLDLLEAALGDDRHKKNARVTLAAIGHLAELAPRGDNLIRLGRIQNDRLMSWAYSAASVFVIPSREDNMPNVVLEAMACGTPIVGFSVGGIPDMVRSGVSGLLARPEDVSELRRAIEVLISDQALRDYMSVNCRRITLEEYCARRQAEKYKAVYEELIETFARTHADIN